MHEPSVIQIDLSAIAHNLGVVRRIIGDATAVCPIVKADAYGLGAVRVAKRLAESGADMLAVYTAAQATELVRGAIVTPILVLMPVRDVGRTDDLYRALVAGRLHLAIHDASHLSDVQHLAERFGTVIPVHLEVDTGMSRGGAGLSEAPHLLADIAAGRWLRPAGLFTHFSSADSDPPLTDAQLARFDAFIEEHASLIPADCVIHAASTFATIRHERYHKTMVRVGLAWAGYGVESLAGGEVISEAQDLRPTVTWSSRVVHVKWIDAGARVGYGGQWTASRPSRIGLVPVGYADGYPIACGGSDSARDPARVGVIVETSEGLKRSFVPVVGAVNMDQITIDLTELPESRTGVGSVVELITPDVSAPNHVPRLAARAGTIPHEVLTRLNPRLRRVYLVRSDDVETVAVPSAIAI